MRRMFLTNYITLKKSIRIHKKKIRRKRILKEKRKRGTLYPNVPIVRSFDIKKKPIKAPEDLSFLNNPSKPLVFFNQLRSRQNISRIKGVRFIEISLKNLKLIDFASISILKSIFEEFNYLGVEIRGSFPVDENCKDILRNFGFFNNMFNDIGKPIIEVKTQGQYHKFEKSQGKIKNQEFKLIEDISEECFYYLNKNEGYYDELETILKEIAGNAVEWGDSYNKQWQIGVLKEKNKIILNVVDLGKGIIDSLFISEKLRFIDFWFFRSKLDVLKGAFDRRYGSFTQEVNRNRGLPMIKRFYEDKYIQNLIVCSNEGFINFANTRYNRLLNKDYEKFHGTFYQWEIIAK